MNNFLIFSLLTINTLLIILLAFWLVNKTCSLCPQEMPLKRVFTLKTKCSTCQGGKHE